MSMTISRAIAYPVMVLSALGVVVSTSLFVLSLVGAYHAFKGGPPLIFLGIFVVWVPTVILMNRLTRDFKQKDVWKAALRGCPSWMRIGLWVFTGVVVAITFLPVIWKGQPGEDGFTVFPAIFYAASFCTMYSLIHVDEVDANSCCLNGHPMSPLAKFCEECGSPAAPVGLGSNKQSWQ